MRLVNSNEKIRKPLVWLEVNKDNLRKNIMQIKQSIKPSKIMAVLKANAYGLGIVPITTAIEKNVDMFGVVGIKDAIAIKQTGTKKPIINLGIYSVEDAEMLIKNNIRPTIFTISALQNFEKILKKSKSISSIWIKVDTGFCRLGIPWQETVEFIKAAAKLKNIKVEGVYSTLTENKPFDKVQLKRFLAIKNECQKLNINIPIWSLASSEAVFLFPEACLNMVRVGISLFGFYPSKKAKNTKEIKLTPAISFKTRIACIKELEKGESIFYRQKFIAKRKTRVAILLAGYSYGLDSQCVNGSKVLIRGKQFPLVGGIGITNCFVDIGMNNNIRAGDETILFGTEGKKEIPLEKVCSYAGQSEYEFLSRIPEKVERILQE